MKKTLALAISSTSLLAFPLAVNAETVETAAGAFDVSMNVSLASDYIYRGISQTQGKGAIQGGLDIAHESGLYIGTWASNVDFGPGSTTSVEFDYYVGLARDINDVLSFDLGWVRYAYPGENELSVRETYGSLSAYGFTLGAAYAYDPDSTLYTYLGYEYQLPYEIGLGLQYGTWDLKDDDVYRTGKDNYSDWSVGLSKTFAGVDFGLTYTDTNIKGSDCRNNVGKSDYCEANFVVSASKTF